MADRAGTEDNGLLPRLHAAAGDGAHGDRHRFDDGRAHGILLTDREGLLGGEHSRS